MSKFFKENFILLGIVLGVIVGGVIGSILPGLGVKLGFLGELFLNALKMIVLPLIIVSITLSIIQLGNARNFGSVGMKTIFYYTITTAVAVFIGIVVVLTINPGEGGGAFAGALPENVKAKEGFSFIDLLLSLFPPNIISAANEFKILPLVVASVLFGVAFSKLGGEGRVIEELFSAVNKAIMKIVQWIIYFAPIGIMGLISYRIGIAGGGEAVADLVVQLGKYSISVVAGLLIHGLIILPVILFVFTRRNPFIYVSQLSKALLTAFGTASSSATLPITMKCTEEDAGVSPKITRFVLPMGATVNMDGTALYEAVAVIFIAQSYGIALSPTELIAVFLTATLAAIGAAGIPEAGLITMVLVLQAVGLPIEGIGLILAIDWFLDRFRTTVNVWGDAVGSAVIEKWEGGGEGEQTLTQFQAQVG
ncbi:MAG: dicarboxylate/amino acid:cation symporter [Thermodesulfobacteriota bacterium]